MKTKTMRNGCPLCYKNEQGETTWIEKINTSSQDYMSGKVLIVDHSPICNSCSSELLKFGINLKIVAPSRDFKIQLLDSNSLHR
jgi:hypothetical protein